MAHNVGSPIRHVHSLPCYESPAHLASTPKAILTPRRVSQSAFPVAVGDVSVDDAFPGEYISYTLTTSRLSGGVGTPSASVE
jgi:hypothetical protein